MNYDEIKKKLMSIDGTRIKPVESSNAEEFGLPIEYKDFLAQVGYGRIGNSRFQFFDGVVFVDEIYGYETPETAGLLVFGDDYQGTCIAFDRENWGVVRVMPDQTVLPVASSFELFIMNEFL